MISLFFNTLPDNQHNNDIQESSRMLCTRVEPSCEPSDELSECWKWLYIGQTFSNFTRSDPIRLNMLNSSDNTRLRPRSHLTSFLEKSAAFSAFSAPFGRFRIHGYHVTSLRLSG